mgnify:CR=1 FL=1
MTGREPKSRMRGVVGVLALQGDFREHKEALKRLGIEAKEVRKVKDLEGLKALIVPGGESTTIGKLAREYGLERNAFGRQVESFEEDLEVEGLGPFHGVFIRAPVFRRLGEGVEVLARLGDLPVLVRQGKVLASSFHPELTEDPRLHRYFLELAGV